MLTGSAVLGMLSRSQARNASTGRMADAFSTCSRGSSALTVSGCGGLCLTTSMILAPRVAMSLFTCAPSHAMPDRWR